MLALRLKKVTTLFARGIQIYRISESTSKFLGVMKLRLIEFYTQDQTILHPSIQNYILPALTYA
jgi:hypothetical protein